MQIIKVISKSKSGKKLEVIGEENNIKRTLHVIKDGDKYKFFDGYEYKKLPIKPEAAAISLLLHLPIIPELVKTDIPKYKYATMKGE